MPAEPIGQRLSASSDSSLTVFSDDNRWTMPTLRRERFAEWACASLNVSIWAQILRLGLIRGPAPLFEGWIYGISVGRHSCFPRSAMR